MKRLLGLLLVLGMVGCGSQEVVADAVQKSTPDEAVAALEKLGARIERNEQGDVVRVYLSGTPITAAGLVYLKEMTKLENLELEGTQITDAGLVHLAGMTNLEALILFNTQITDAGLVHLQRLTRLASLSPIHPGDRCGHC